MTPDSKLALAFLLILGLGLGLIAYGLGLVGCSMTASTHVG